MILYRCNIADVVFFLFLVKDITLKLFYDNCKRCFNYYLCAYVSAWVRVCVGWRVCMSVYLYAFVFMYVSLVAYFALARRGYRVVPEVYWMRSTNSLFDHDNSIQDKESPLVWYEGNCNIETIYSETFSLRKTIFDSGSEVCRRKPSTNSQYLRPLQYTFFFLLCQESLFQFFSL